MLAFSYMDRFEAGSHTLGSLKPEVDQTSVGTRPFTRSSLVVARHSGALATRTLVIATVATATITTPLSDMELRSCSIDPELPT